MESLASNRKPIQSILYCLRVNMVIPSLLLLSLLMKMTALLRRSRAEFWKAKFNRGRSVYKSHLLHTWKIEVCTFVWIRTKWDATTALKISAFHSVTSSHPCLSLHRAPSAHISEWLHWKWGCLALCRMLPLINSFLPLWIEEENKTALF